MAGASGAFARVPVRIARLPDEPVHRADIDGLRAIAVTAVILLHAGVTGLPGGFLGVDVFFVISGYLIHKDLTRRLSVGAFAPLAFYARRLRRTLPALYLVTAVTLVAAWFIVMPGDFDAAARSAVATMVSLSNLWFFEQVGYFDRDALSKPLLHTWSLGVEEQFYLCAPVVSFGLYQIRAAARPLAYLGLLALTFAGCVALQRVAPEAAFFFLPARAWEFLLGCALADGVVPAFQRSRVADIVGSIALLAMLGAFSVVSERSAHPGFPTLVACGATAAILHLGETHRSLVTRLLGCRPVAFVGLISYSLYLWHWPLIVFAQYLDIPSTPLTQTALLAVVFALSVATWRLIEQPFRDPASPWRRRAAPALAGGFCAILIGSAGIVAARGFPQRFPSEVARIASYFDYVDRRDFREGACFLTSKFDSLAYFDRAMCLKRSDTKPNYLLIGDSQAAHYWVGLSSVFRDANIMQATASGCKPILNVVGSGYCHDLMTYVLKDFLPDAHLDGVVFAAAWDVADAASLAATVRAVKTHTQNVVVLGRLPLHDVDLPNLLGRSLVEHRPDLVLRHQLDYPWRVEVALKDKIGLPTYVSLVALVCPERRCVVLASQFTPLQFDKSHLTSEGSVFVAQRLRDGGLFAERPKTASDEISPHRE